MRRFFTQLPTRHLASASVLAAALTLTACDPDFRDDTGGLPTGPSPIVVGSGVIVTESRDVRGFNGISYGGSGSLIIEQTGFESLSITTDDNILPLLTSDVSGGRLVLGQRDDVGGISTTGRVVYRLTVRRLGELDIRGSALVDATGIDTSMLEVSLNGSLNMTISGAADRQTINVSGSTSYQAGELASREVSIVSAGSSQVTVRVSSRLDVRISGSGRINYFGDPTVEVDISGSGSVQRVGP